MFSDEGNSEEKEKTYSSFEEVKGTKVETAADNTTRFSWRRTRSIFCYCPSVDIIKDSQCYHSLMVFCCPTKKCIKRSLFTSVFCDVKIILFTFCARLTQLYQSQRTAVTFLIRFETGKISISYLIKHCMIKFLYI